MCSLDIDECDLGQHQCNHICDNKIGSYECLCTDGYKLDSDEFTCNGRGDLYNICLSSDYCICPKILTSVKTTMVDVIRYVSMALDPTPVIVGRDTREALTFIPVMVIKYYSAVSYSICQYTRFGVD